MNIILIGYRGSGKTTLGKMLADRLWISFVDVDDEIRKHFDGLTIAQIWHQRGEKAFRQVETEVTEQLVAKSDMVIALGGGTLMQPAARRAVQEAEAIRIYLQCDPQELLRRTSADSHSADTRPNLTGLGGTVEEIEAMLKERQPVYEAVADKVFEVTNLEPEDALRYLVDRCL